MRSSNDQSLSEILKELSKVPVLRDKLYQLKLEEAWKTQMGPTIAGYTREFQLKDGVVYVKLGVAPLRAEMIANRHQIVDLLNEALGEVIVKEVKIR